MKYQFYEKWVSVREKNIKLLLETDTYITATETPICIITIKIVTHIFTVETFTCISAAETSNCITGIETVTCIIATERSTSISVAESTTKMIAIEPQNLHSCKRCCHPHIIVIESVNCIVPTKTATCGIDYRNFPLQKWCQSEILLVIMKKLSEWVSTKFKTSNLMKRLDSALCQRIVSYIDYSNFQFSYLHTIYKTNNITTKPGLKVKSYF